MAEVKEDEKPNASFFHREESPTAANMYDRKFGPSGVQTYRVTVAGAMGLAPVDVDASTGDEAAELALAKFPGAKVIKVEPAPQKKAA